MSNAVERQPRELPRRNHSIYRVHYALPRETKEVLRPVDMYKHMSHCVEIQAYSSQVAGHQALEDAKYLGLLQCSNGTILKPILKPSQRREVDFYTTLWSSDSPDLLELRKLTAKYFGSRKITYNGEEHEYIILEDLTYRMLQPCIMDLKIGRRTWDPLASEEKIKSEESKYSSSKHEFGFCIPGYQVYKISTGRLAKYNKQHGKKLTGEKVVEAIKTFLNGMGRSMSRALVLAMLTELWRVQRWAHKQTTLKLYSASLLLVYDATRNLSAAPPPAPLPSRRRSVPAMSGGSFSGQLSHRGPVYSKVNPVPLSPLGLAHSSLSPPLPSLRSPWTEALDKIKDSHSFEHNYENKLCKMKMNYHALLDELSSDTPTPNPLGTVKIIDFVHAFFNEDDDRSLDTNFMEGIDNLVAIFEKFLKETEGQVL